MEITEEAALLYIHELVDPFMDFTQIELSYSIKSNWQPADYLRVPDHFITVVVV